VRYSHFNGWEPSLPAIVTNALDEDAPVSSSSSHALTVDHLHIIRDRLSDALYPSPSHARPSDRFFIAPSTLKNGGLGLFARVPIQSGGAFLMDYAGDIIVHDRRDRIKCDRKRWKDIPRFDTNQKDQRSSRYVFELAR